MLDIENRKCHAREADVNYFTDGLVKTDIKVLTEDEINKLSGNNEKLKMEAAFCDVLVRSQIKKLKN